MMAWIVHSFLAVPLEETPVVRAGSHPNT